MKNIQSEILNLLKKQGKTLGTAESLTAGLISSSFADISGSSSVLKGGIVSYQLSVKENILSIPKDILKEDAVNKETSILMAKNTSKLLEADFILSSTGIAEQYDEREPLAYCSIYDKEKDNNINFLYKFSNSIDRNTVRKMVVQKICEDFLIYLLS